MTEPTDAEAWEMWLSQPLTGHAPKSVGSFARAVLAKFGTPAVAGEPECTCSAKDMPFGTCCKVRSVFERWYDEQNDGRLQPFDVFKGGWIERHRLSSTPQPTQAQAGAVPLTRERLQEISLDYSDSEDECIGFRDGWRAAEKHHGIKGGQHGAE